MIDFSEYKEFQLREIATYERAIKNKIYPSGASTLQISATRGQIGYLEKEGKVKTKNAVIIPNKGINPKYFNIVLEKNIKKFMNKYATGINIKLEEIGNIEMQLHKKQVQDLIAEAIKESEENEKLIERNIKTLEEIKQTFLKYMFI